MSEGDGPQRLLGYTDHARTVMRERGVDPVWVERVVGDPETWDLDPFQPQRRRAFGRIAEFGDRWLRVVYEVDDNAVLIVTAFFDRNAGRRS